MSTLEIVAYNVKFGDAILVTVPERVRGREITRHLLIDVGNVLAGAGADMQLFRLVTKDLLHRLDGRAIDLYVMTHEHMDHVQGLLRAHHLGVQLPAIDYAWLTGSAHPSYYKRFPGARSQRERHLAAYEDARLAVAARGIAKLASVRAFLANNDPRRTADCVAFLRTIARKKTRYVNRDFSPRAGRDHPFKEARFSIWAPERDTSMYYGRMQPVLPARIDKTRSRRLRAPAGVSQRALDELLKFAASGLGENMLAIDRAANNTSVVFELEWRGWRLLFSGDAELRSWKTMQRNKQLRPVHFLKVGHHASHNGTPSEAILESIFPTTRTDQRRRCVLVSTCADTYSGVPDAETLARLGSRVDQVFDTRSVPVGQAVEIGFEDEGEIGVKRRRPV